MLPQRLLLVEDDRALAELVSFHFDRAGYAVTRTGDGEEHERGWHRGLAAAVALVVALGNLSFPVAVLTGIVS